MLDNKKIATLNLCLGLKNKKENVKKMIMDNDIDILCLQETEVTKYFPIDLLTFKGFNYENESNTLKSRCGVYLWSVAKVIPIHKKDLKLILKTIGLWPISAHLLKFLKN